MFEVLKLDFLKDDLSSKCLNQKAFFSTKSSLCFIKEGYILWLWSCWNLLASGDDEQTWYRPQEHVFYTRGSNLDEKKNKFSTENYFFKVIYQFLDKDQLRCRFEFLVRLFHIQFRIDFDPLKYTILSESSVRFHSVIEDKSWSKEPMHSILHKFLCKVCSCRLLIGFWSSRCRNFRLSHCQSNSPLT